MRTENTRTTRRRRLAMLGLLSLLVFAAGAVVAYAKGGTAKPPTKQRYSIRLTAPTDVDGRQTAKRMDVYFTEVARGCKLSSFARGVVSWRGNRKG